MSVSNAITGMLPSHGGLQQVGGVAVASNDDNNRRKPHVTRACDICRSRKCKCDAKEPQCGPCEMWKLPCAYTGRDNRKRGAARTKADIAELQSRVAALETIVQTMAEMLEERNRLVAPKITLTIHTEDVHEAPLTPTSSESPSPYDSAVESIAGADGNQQPLLRLNGGLLAVPDSQYQHARRHYRSPSVSSTDSELIPSRSVTSARSSPTITTLIDELATFEGWGDQSDASTSASTFQDSEMWATLEECWKAVAGGD